MRKAKLLWGLLLAVVAAQPPNDNPCGAIALTPGTGCTYTKWKSQWSYCYSGRTAPWLCQLSRRRCMVLLRGAGKRAGHHPGQ